MEYLNNLIERCFERNAKPLRAKRSVMHAVETLKDKTDEVECEWYPYHAQVFYAHERDVMATRFAAVGLGILPIGHHGNAYFHWSELFENHWDIMYTMQHWEQRYWRDSWGLQVFTGEPSGYLTELDFEYKSVSMYPQQTLDCIERLCKLTDKPLLTISKSGGLRFSCRTPGYLHPRAKESQEYVSQFIEINEDGNTVVDLLLEIISERNLIRWDSRYEIVTGDLFDIPEIGHPQLFAALEPFKQELSTPAPDVPPSRKTKASKRSNTKKRTAQTAYVPVDYKIIVQNLTSPDDWRKKSRGELKSRRGDFPCNFSDHPNTGPRVQFFMKKDGQVNAFCHNCRKYEVVIEPTKRKTERERIAELIAQAPAPEPIPTKAEQRANLIARIKRGDASPLELQRAKPIKHDAPIMSEFASQDENSQIIRDAFDKDTRVVLLIAETGSGKNYQMEEFIKSGGKVTKTAPTRALGLADEQRMSDRGITGEFWRTRFWNWKDQLKRSEEDLLMYPFSNGAMCIDADRCETIRQRGGNPKQIICPNCPVQDLCKDEGYLSQPSIMQVSEAQILAISDMFTNPDLAAFTDVLLQPIEILDKKISRTGVIDEAKAYNIFRECRLLKSQLQEWRDMWIDRPLGQFTQVLIEIFEVVKPEQRTRALREFILSIPEDLEEKIVSQMRSILCEGHIIEKQIPGLSEIAMKFVRNEAEVAIAVDWDAYKELIELGTPVLPPYEYKAHDYVELSFSQVIRFGIYSDEHIETIFKIPKVEGSQTTFHKLKILMEHYLYDKNVPLYYTDKAIVFHIPPTLHPNLQRLVAMSATLNPEHTRRAFHNIPDSDFEVVQTPYSKLYEGSKIFQIRTGAYPRSSLLELNDNYKPVSMKPRCGQFFEYIEKQLQREEYTHAVITFKPICDWIGTDWMDTYEYLRFFDNFDNMEGLSDIFDDVQCLWIIGTPELSRNVIEQYSKAIYGTDEEVLKFDRDENRLFTDQRVQSVYESIVVAKLKQAVGRLRLNRHAKKVFLFSNIFIPSISDREECVQFDFEDCELTDSINEIEWRVRQRELAEDAQEDMEHTILDRLLQGQSGNSLIEQGFKESIVNRMLREHKDVLDHIRERAECDDRIMLQRVYDREGSLRATSRATGKSIHYIKKVLGL